MSEKNPVLNLYQRINKVMSELSYVKKTASVGYGQNTYSAVTHDHVTSKMQPLCVKHGIVLKASMKNTTIQRYTVQTKKGESDRYETQADVVVTAVNIDNPDEFFEVTATAHGFDTQDKSPGKAFSMAVKYCYLKLFMLESGDQEEERVEMSKVVNSNRKALESELIELLKENGNFTNEFASFIPKMKDVDLNAKIKEYKQKLKGEENE